MAGNYAGWELPVKQKVLIAVGLALLTVVCLWFYSRSVQEAVAGGRKVTVVVAATELSPGARITRANLAQQEIPEAYVHASAIRRGEEAQILGRAVSAKINQGQPLLWSDFELGRSAAMRRLSANIPKGQRAFTLPVDLSGSIAGMLRPGDRVDLMGTFARSQGSDWATVTLLQNVLVLATGDLRQTGEGEEGIPQSQTQGSPHLFNSITVAVDLEEAELMAFSVQRGPVSVALRAQDDQETVEEIPDKNFGDIFEVTKRAAFTRRHAQKKIEALKAQ